MEPVEETARRLYPTSPKQRYGDKMASKACQRAYLRGHMHGRQIDRAFIAGLVMDIHENGLSYLEVCDHIASELELAGFFIPPEKG